jgi:esterase/lipase superfamily enzyme
LLAHGCGVELFQKFCDKGMAPPDRSVSNLFLFAPDLDANVFAKTASESSKRLGSLMSSISDQLYVFYSHGDQALRAVQERKQTPDMLGLEGALGEGILVSKIFMCCAVTL